MFGRGLEETMEVETRLGGGYIPILLHRCVSFLRQQGASPLHSLCRHLSLSLCVCVCRSAGSGCVPSAGPDSPSAGLEGALRPGSEPAAGLRGLSISSCVVHCAGCQQDFPAIEDVHTVASLLKLYLRELPEPLVPFTCYSHFQSAVKSASPSLALALLEVCVVSACVCPCRAGRRHGQRGGGPAEGTAADAKSQPECHEVPRVSPSPSPSPSLPTCSRISPGGSCMRCRSALRRIR